MWKLYCGSQNINTRPISWKNTRSTVEQQVFILRIKTGTKKMTKTSLCSHGENRKMEMEKQVYVLRIKTGSDSTVLQAFLKKNKSFHMSQSGSSGANAEGAQEGLTCPPLYFQSSACLRSLWENQHPYPSLRVSASISIPVLGGCQSQRVDCHRLTTSCEYWGRFGQRDCLLPWRTTLA